VPRFWLIIVAVLAGAASMILLSAIMAPERQDDIWVELAKGAATIVALSLATGVVGAMLRDRDALREDQRRRSFASSSVKPCANRNVATACRRSWNRLRC
jgi:hypothetical protein